MLLNRKLIRICSFILGPAIAIFNSIKKKKPAMAIFDSIKKKKCMATMILKRVKMMITTVQQTKVEMALAIVLILQITIWMMNRMKDQMTYYI
eukprot:527589-Ditylum_brightwellii.AAC.1